MALLKRAKTSIYGLEGDLTTLNTDISAEVTRATTAEGTLTTNLNNEITARTNADSTLTTNLANEVTRATTAEGTLTTNLANEVTRATGVEGSLTSLTTTDKTSLVAAINEIKSSSDITALTATVNTINGDSTTTGSFRKAIADVIGTAPETLNTLKEIADAINNDPNLNTTLTTLVSSSITSAKEELKGTVTTAMDTLGEIETAISNEVTRATAAEGTKLTKTSNLSDLSDIATARTNLSVYSKAEVDSTVGSLSNVSKNVSGTITNDRVEFPFAPIGGLDGVAFGIVRIFGVISGVPSSYDEVEITLYSTDVTGKTFNIHGESAGIYEGKTAKAFITCKP